MEFSPSLDVIISQTLPALDRYRSHAHQQHSQQSTLSSPVPTPEARKAAATAAGAAAAKQYHFGIENPQEKAGEAMICIMQMHES